MISFSIDGSKENVLTHAKKVVSDSPGLVDFAFGQVKIFRRIKITEVLLDKMF